MTSVKRLVSTCRRPRHLRNALMQNPVTLLLLLGVVSTTFIVQIYSRQRSTFSNMELSRSNFENSLLKSGADERDIIPTPAVTPRENQTPTVVSKKMSPSGENAKQYDDYEVVEIEDPNLFSDYDDSDSFFGKALKIAERINGKPLSIQSVMGDAIKFAKNMHKVSTKINKISQKIDNQNLDKVQGFVSAEEKQIRDDKTTDDIPLGPEARGNENFEKMQQEGESTSFFKSLVQQIGPAVLVGIGNSVTKSSENSSADSPSIIQDLIKNVGPKIISGVFNANNGQTKNDGNKFQSRGSSTGTLNLLEPVVKTVIEKQDGDKGEVNSAVSSVMSVIGGLAPLLQHSKNGGTRTIYDTVSILQPVLSAMAPSIMNKILVSKHNDGHKYIAEDPLAGGSLPENKLKDSTKKHTSQEGGGDPVGLAVGRALRSVMISSLPNEVPLPQPSSIRKPYDMALNLVMGNPMANKTSGWQWLRGLAGDKVPLQEPPKWVQRALQNQERMNFKEDIQRLNELIWNIEPSCKKIKNVGGLYNWKMNKIIGNRTVCNEYDIWKSSPCKVVSFVKTSEYLSFEEQMAKQYNCAVYVVAPKLETRNTSNMYIFKGNLASGREETSNQYGTSSYSSWLERWRLKEIQIQYLKIDQGGGEWRVLRSLLDNDHLALMDVMQMSVTARMDEALIDPSLYKEWVETLKTLSSFGFQLFIASPEGSVFYNDPLYDDRKLSLQYQLNFIRI